MSSGVEFEEDKFSYVRPRPQISTGIQQDSGYQFSNSDPKMVRFLIRHGWVKTPAAAQNFLVGLIIINILITLFVVYFYIL